MFAGHPLEIFDLLQVDGVLFISEIDKRTGVGATFRNYNVHWAVGIDRIMHRRLMAGGYEKYRQRDYQMTNKTQNPKSEFRNNAQRLENRMFETGRLRGQLGVSDFEHSDLFRTSIFEFRI